MLKITFLISLPCIAVYAATNSACSAGGTPGVCLTTTSCSSGGGTPHSGYCPNDPSNIQCCTKTCGSGGTCRLSSSCTSGRTQTGLCPGPSNFVCCFSDSTTTTTTTSGSCAAPAVNSATVALIKQSEGFVAKPAPDPIGLPTVGYGHLCKTKKCGEVTYSFPLTDSTATSLLSADLKTPENCITSDISKSVKLNTNQYGALVTWAFNVGCGNAASSSLIKRLNAGQSPNTVAAEELPKWNKAGGRVLPGLVKRRAAEVKLFQTASTVNAHPSC